jgi:hypothetical protein
MKLLWSYDLGHEFGKLSQVVCLLFLIDLFFSILSFNIGLIGI